MRIKDSTSVIKLCKVIIKYVQVTTILRGGRDDNIAKNEI